MSYLPQTNWGDCTLCENKDCACIKKGKSLVCLNCNNKSKADKQIERSKRIQASRNASNKLRSIAGTNVEIRASKDYGELDRWFKERQKEMSGRCENCSGKTEAHTKHFKCSIAHILPKAYFPSVATHPDNWLELCFYSNSCHTNFDNKMIDLIDLNCFDTVIQKFVKIYPHIAQEEKRRIPPILIEYLKTEV